MKKKPVLLLLGCILALVLLEAGLQIAGFFYAAHRRTFGAQAPHGGAVYTVLCIGESTTDGKYPKQLEKILNSTAGPVTYAVIDKGRGGATTDYLLAEIEDNIAIHRPDMIVAMMGINDNRDDIVYEAGPAEKKRYLKTYTLARLAWLHARSTIQRWRKSDSLPEKQAVVSAYVDEAKERSLRKQGYGHFDNREYIKAKAYFNQILAINPESFDAYIGLAKCEILMRSNLPAAERYCKKALEIDPSSEEGYIELGLCYREMGNTAQEESMFLKALRINPESEKGNLYLSFLYYREKRFDEYRKIYDKLGAGKMKPLDITHFSISTLEETAGPAARRPRSVSAEVGANDWGWYSPAAVYNFRKLGKICKENGIRLVCMQYPRVSVKPLLRIFKPGDGVLFVDNEAVFDKAVKKEGYAAYFLDSFGRKIGYEFGHCTIKGDVLLAENLAKTIRNTAEQEKTRQ